MKRLVLITIILTLTAYVPALAYQSLQEIYDNADGNGLYDKYIQLNPDLEYLGDLRISDSVNVRIDGKGAVIFGIDEEVAVNIHYANVDISNCVIVGGSCGIFFGAGASGDIYCNTITGSTFSGIAVTYPDLEAGVEVWDNIITESFFGLYCVEDYHPRYIGYNTVYDTESFRYAELCPG
ncbi:MAG: hypothetical protein V3W18_12975 [candidate division Zixibacteria bacterium]